MSSTLPPELKRVRLALQQHRRQFGRQRIPDTIRQQTVSLLSVYPRKQVINTLGISYKMLCSWTREQTASAVDPAAESMESMHFVSLPVTTEPALAPDSALPAIELRFTDEVKLVFQGANAGVQCLQLLQGLGYGRDSVTVNPVVAA